MHELASLRIPHLHILATSREESDIRTGLISWRMPLLIDETKVVEDIRLFVKNEMSKDRNLSSQGATIKIPMMHRLVDDSHGMYVMAKFSN